MKRIVGVVLASLIALTVIAINLYKPIIHPCTQEYLPGTGNIKGNVNVEKWLAYGEEFAIRVDVDGYAVFKDPEAALKSAKSIFADAIADIRAQNDAPSSLTKYTYQYYYVDVTGDIRGNAKEIREFQGFLDIYENSYSEYYSRPFSFVGFDLHDI